MIAHFISQDEQYSEGLKNVLEITIPQLEIKTYRETPLFIDPEVSILIIEPIFDGANRNIEIIKNYTETDNLRICLLLESFTEGQLLELLSYKVHGVCFKSEHTLKIIKGITQVLKGGYYIPENVGKLLLDVYQQ